MPKIDVDGDRLHYTENGAGIPVVFIHGSCGGAAQWKVLAGTLSDQFKTICLDLFGSGESEPWPIEREWSPQDDDRAIDAILNLVGEPVHFVIHSGGGCFSWPSIKNRTGQIRSLTFFEPAYFHLLRQSANPLFAEPEGMAKRYRQLMEAGDRDAAMASFVDTWARKEGTWNGLPNPIKNAMKLGSDRLYHEWLGPWFDEPSLDELADLDIPTLLFVGTETLASEYRVCEIISETLPDCQIQMVEGAGHMAPFTHASSVINTLVGHLNAN